MPSIIGLAVFSRYFKFDAVMSFDWLTKNVKLVEFFIDGKSTPTRMSVKITES